MGSESSTQRHYTAERGKWARSSEVFDIRVPPLETEMRLRGYYDCYLKQCERNKDSFNLVPNEEFQMSLESLDEDRYQRSSDVADAAARHYHNIVSFCVEAIDDIEHKPDRFLVENVNGAGTAYVKGGFFFFLWENYVGEKLGRLELRMCRRILELGITHLHVPLTYHIIYKARAFTIQALAPISPATQLHPPYPDEVVCLTREVLDCFNVKPYEVHQEMITTPPDVQIHCGWDGRYYTICNFQWTPPWPASRRDRATLAQRFSCFRPEILAQQPLAVNCRAFHRTAFVTDNTSALQLTRMLVDQYLHETMKIIGSVADSGPTTILKHFRQCGFNYSLLGILLLSLNRNMAPPEDAVRRVTLELFARGIKEFVYMRVGAEVSETTDELMAGMNAAKTMDLPALSSGAQGRSEDESLSITVGGFDLGSPADGSNPMGSAPFTAVDMGGGFGSDNSSPNSRGTRAKFRNRVDIDFIHFLETVLRSLLEYEGAPVPRPATLFQAAVYPPTDLFGGEVIPYIYTKFRLITSDIDLYKKLPNTLKLDIYNRVCSLCGVTIKDGKISQVVPIVLTPSLPTVGIPLWIEKRLETLGSTLFVGSPLRSLWVQQGSATIVLLRHQAKFWRFYEVVLHFVSTFSPDRFLWHALENAMDRKSLVKAGKYRGENIETEMDKVLFINLLRRLAFASYDEGKPEEASMHMERVLEIAAEVLEVCGNPFAPQYRRFCSEAVLYNPETRREEIEATMLKNISRFCAPDTLVAQDFLQMGVVRLQEGDETAALQLMHKARRAFVNVLGDEHIKTQRCIANVASLLTDEQPEEAFKLLRQLVQNETRLEDVVAASHEVLAHIAPDEIANAEAALEKYQAEDDLEDEPYRFIAHVSPFV